MNVSIVDLRRSPRRTGHAPAARQWTSAGKECGRILCFSAASMVVGEVRGLSEPSVYLLGDKRSFRGLSAVHPHCDIAAASQYSAAWYCCQ